MFYSIRIANKISFSFCHPPSALGYLVHLFADFVSSKVFDARLFVASGTGLDGHVCDLKCID